MPFQPRALEVLHGPAILHELLGKRIAEDGEAALAVPEAQDGALRAVPGGREEAMAGVRGEGGDGRESARAKRFGPEPAKRDLTAGRPGGVPFQASALQILHG